MNRDERIKAAVIGVVGVFLGIVPKCEGAVRLENGIDDLLDAIAKVESDNDPNAYNEVEDAAGLFQIRPIYLRDVNRILGEFRYQPEDRFDPYKSREMVLIYLNHYGKNKSYEQLARIHNGGPRGHKKKATLKYWEEVKKRL